MQIDMALQQHGWSRRTRDLSRFGFFVTFHVRCSRRDEMYIGHTCLCVCRRMPTLLYRPGYNLGEWQGVPPSCALLSRFAIGAWVSLL